MTSLRSHSFRFWRLLAIATIMLLLAACGAPAIGPDGDLQPPTVPAVGTSTPTLAPSPDRGSPVPPTDTAQVSAELKTQFLADAGITLAPEGAGDGFTDVGVVPLTSEDGPYWAAFTVGLRAYENKEPLPHQLAIYTREGEDWKQAALHSFADGDPDSPAPDYIGVDSVRQAQVEPENVWVEVNGGAGAHSGVYHLLRFDGDKLNVEASGFNDSPDAGHTEDINGDGMAEVVLNATDPYVFCYACGVRDVQYNVLRWDGTQMQPVALTPLDESAPEDLREVNDRAGALALAGLWKDALGLVGELEALNADAKDETVAWNIALIRLTGNARRAEAKASAYPILGQAFFGDYVAAVEPFRAFEPATIFAQPSALVTDTEAEGWEEALSASLLRATAAAVNVMEPSPQMAAAFFLPRLGRVSPRPQRPRRFGEHRPRCATDHQRPFVRVKLRVPKRRLSVEMKTTILFRFRSL